ncbi:carbonic anhydrase [Acetobacteraceae bacterium H6797]|nr:carbonic anhydrase [Acetobacteraceae bacterium H6797]
MSASDDQPPPQSSDLSHLFEGHQRFRRTRWRQQRSRFTRLAREGQAPHSCVIACCDSRVTPEVVFDAGPGELFVGRSIANLVPVYTPDGNTHGTSAALEYAVTALGVSNVVILGHSRCGGIRALVDFVPETQGGDFIGPWMAIAVEARNRAFAKAANPEDRDEVARLCEKESLQLSLDNLMTFPWIKAAVESGKLTLAGLYYDVDKGTLTEVGRLPAADGAKTAA